MLTADEILAMDGVGMANAIARHVMGWTPVVFDDSRCGKTWRDAKNGWHLVPHRPFDKPTAGLFAIVAEVWEPHRKADDAIGVIVHACEQFGLEFMGGKWTVSIGSTTLTDESLPMAICRAVLWNTVPR